MFDLLGQVYQDYGPIALAMAFLAAALWLMWRDGRNCEKERREHAEKLACRYHDQNDRMIDTVERNAAANMKLATAIESLKADLQTKADP